MRKSFLCLLILSPFFLQAGDAEERGTESKVQSVAQNIAQVEHEERVAELQDAANTAQSTLNEGAVQTQAPTDTTEVVLDMGTDAPQVVAGTTQIALEEDTDEMQAVTVYLQKEEEGSLAALTQSAKAWQAWAIEQTPKTKEKNPVHAAMPKELAAAFMNPLFENFQPQKKSPLKPYRDEIDARMKKGVSARDLVVMYLNFLALSQPKLSETDALLLQSVGLNCWQKNGSIISAKILAQYILRNKLNQYLYPDTRLAASYWQSLDDPQPIFIFPFYGQKAPSIPELTALGLKNLYPMLCTPNTQEDTYGYAVSPLVRIYLDMGRAHNNLNLRWYTPPLDAQYACLMDQQPYDERFFKKYFFLRNNFFSALQNLQKTLENASCVQGLLFFLTHESSAAYLRPTSFLGSLQEVWKEVFSAFKEELNGKFTHALKSSPLTGDITDANREAVSNELRIPLEKVQGVRIVPRANGNFVDIYWLERGALREHHATYPTMKTTVRSNEKYQEIANFAFGKSSPNYRGPLRDVLESLGAASPKTIKSMTPQAVQHAEKRLTARYRKTHENIIEVLRQGNKKILASFKTPEGKLIAQTFQSNVYCIQRMEELKYEGDVPTYLNAGLRQFLKGEKMDTTLTGKESQP